MKKITKIWVLCKVCETPKLIYRSIYKEGGTYFCCKECKVQFLSQPIELRFGKEKADAIKLKLSSKSSGKNNPRFGIAWTEEQKLTQSTLIASKVDDLYREKAGSANRGKKFSESRILLMHGSRDKESYSHVLTDEAKRLIGESSKLRHLNVGYTENIVSKSLYTKEIKGIISPSSMRSDFEVYRKLSNWISIPELLTKEEWDLVSLEGLWNPITKTGLVRDHMLSRFEGFKLKLFPEIVRHPENLRLITQRENSIKKNKSCITIKDLFERIMFSDILWPEKEVVSDLINKYLKGEVWNRIRKE